MRKSLTKTIEPAYSWRFFSEGPWGILAVYGTDRLIWGAEFVSMPLSPIAGPAWQQDYEAAWRSYEANGGDGPGKPWTKYYAWERVTPFTAQVLQATIDILYEEPISYGALAQRIGKPSAARAVGGALGRNLWPVLIPCHRVVGQQGIGGYGGARDLGVKRKEALLQHDHRR